MFYNYKGAFVINLKDDSMRKNEFLKQWNNDWKLEFIEAVDGRGDLCMIVKNESKIIERCLNSVKPLIDYVCIIDTGSTDDTVDVINNWMKSNGVDGQVVFEPWKDFAYNRLF